MATQPNSISEWQSREEQAERREWALNRYKRQQYELDLYDVDAVLEQDNPCPNCGEMGYEAVYGVSEDASTGYSCDEQGCTACIENFIGRTK